MSMKKVNKKTVILLILAILLLVILFFPHPLAIHLGFEEKRFNEGTQLYTISIVVDESTDAQRKVISTEDPELLIQLKETLLSVRCCFAGWYTGIYYTDKPLLSLYAIGNNTIGDFRFDFTVDDRGYVYISKPNSFGGVRYHTKNAELYSLLAEVSLLLASQQ